VFVLLDKPEMSLMGANALAYCCPSVVNEEKKSFILLTRERKSWTEIKAKEK